MDACGDIDSNQDSILHWLLSSNFIHLPVSHWWRIIHLSNGGKPR